MLIFKHISVLCFVILYFSSINFVGAQDVLRRWLNPSVGLEDSTRIQCFINPDLLSDKDRSILVSALLKLSVDDGMFEYIKIKKNENLNLIVKNRFNFYDGEDHKTSKSIVNTIIEMNGLKGDKILAGEEIFIPVLPMKPSKKASSEFSQLYDAQLTMGKVVVTKDENVEQELVNNKNTVQKSDAKIWTYSLRPWQYKNLLEQLPSEMLKRIYGNAIMGSGEPVFIKLNLNNGGKAQKHKSPKIDLNDGTKSKIRSIKNDHFGSYVFMDFFTNACSHGEKVHNVISHVSKKLEISLKDLNVKSVNANYWENKDVSLTQMQTFFKSSAFDDENLLVKRKSYLNEVKVLREAPRNKHSDDEIPELFFCSLFWMNYSANPDILATSISSRVRTMDIFPVEFKRNNTNCLTASGNDTLSLIESFTDIPVPSTGRLLGTEQPITHYYKTPASGFIIVGCQIDSAIFTGMSSSKGDGITTLGYGIGWGGEVTDCIKPGEFGSSFSTPQIGFLLYVAKAYWRSIGKRILPEEARKRLIYSSDVVGGFVGKFASAGVPNINKLLVNTTGFVEQNGVIRDVSKFNFCRIDTDELSGFKFGRMDKINYLNGISISRDKTYVVSEHLPMWTAANINKIEISFTSDDKVFEFKSIEELRKNGISQIVYLNNQ